MVNNGRMIASHHCHHLFSNYFHLVSIVLQADLLPQTTNSFLSAIFDTRNNCRNIFQVEQLVLFPPSVLHECLTVLPDIIFRNVSGGGAFSPSL